LYKKSIFEKDFNRMNYLKKLISWLWPVAIEVRESDINPYLEVIMDRGRLMLNSEMENYSYGSAKTYYRKILKKISLKRDKIRDVLILGFGVGSIASILKEEIKLDCNIKGVEIDKIVLELGKKYFDIDRFANTEVFLQDAYDFVVKENNKYDLIITDVTLNLKTPDKFETHSFFSQIKKLMKDHTVFILNHQVFSRETKDKVQVLESIMKGSFENVQVLSLMSSGRVVIVHNASH
jgi:spermidine synthase